MILEWFHSSITTASTPPNCLDRSTKWSNILTFGYIVDGSSPVSLINIFLDSVLLSPTSYNKYSFTFFNPNYLRYSLIMLNIKI